MSFILVMTLMVVPFILSKNVGKCLNIFVQIRISQKKKKKKAVLRIIGDT